MSAGKAMPPGTRELRVVLERISHSYEPPEYRFIELENQDGRGIGAFGVKPSSRRPFFEIAIPYGRDDEWVQEVVMRAITAGQECDQPFPADVADAVLREFGVRPTMPRSWPPRGKAAIRQHDVVDDYPRGLATVSASEQAPWGTQNLARERGALIDEAHKALDRAAGQAPPSMQLVERCNLLVDRYLEAKTSAVMADNPDRETQLLEDREHARANEDRLKAQRDSALNLLRWLIGDVV